jgi:hypothetical protein
LHRISHLDDAGKHAFPFCRGWTRDRRRRPPQPRVGYGIIIGLGVAFAVVILTAVKIQKVYLSEDSETSEMFMVANQSVDTGA